MLGEGHAQDKNQHMPIVTYAAIPDFIGTNVSTWKSLSLLSPELCSEKLACFAPFVKQL